MVALLCARCPVDELSLLQHLSCDIRNNQICPLVFLGSIGVQARRPWEAIEGVLPLPSFKAHHLWAAERHSIANSFWPIPLLGSD